MPDADPLDLPQTIVAEISKSYINGLPVSSTAPLAHLFELAIAHNRARGYRLTFYTLHRVMTRPDELNETIIATFERIDATSEADLRVAVRMLVEKWRREATSWEPGIASGYEMCADELATLIADAHA